MFQYNSSNCIGVTPVFVENNDIMRSTATAVAVIALFASIFTVTLNALVLFVFYRLKQLHTPSNILIVNMCIADFLTGCVSEPLFLSARLLELHDTDKCSVKQAGLFCGYLFSGISFITLCFISIERWYAVSLPFKYESRFTFRNCIIMVLVAYMVSIVLTSLRLAETFPPNIFYQLFAFFLVSLTIISSLCYVKIYKIAKDHERRIHSLKFICHESNDGTKKKYTGLKCSSEGLRRKLNLSTRASVVRESRKSKIVIIIVLLFVASYSPKIMIMLDAFVVNSDSRVSYVALKWAEVIFFLNSCFNPVLYFLRISCVKEEISRLSSNWALRLRGRCQRV